MVDIHRNALGPSINWGAAVRGTYERMYQADTTPWDLGGPQAAIQELVATGAVTGDVLDPGCGSGWHAIEYGRSGCQVFGVDVSPTAIRRARNNAARAGVAVEFLQGDASRPDALGWQFDTVVDSKFADGLYHASVRARYYDALARIIKPGGRLFMFEFGQGEVDGFHNHLQFVDDYAQVLRGFDVEYVGETTYRLRGPYRPACQKCPPVSAVPPDSRFPIPMVEIHAVRRSAPM